jgi:hypothetical protein
MISAEDLIKTRTIPELRDLTITLELDANGKQTELQHMVGSKYHDFIQSADAIAAMQKKAQFLEEKLADFWKFSDEVALKTEDLLNRTEIRKDISDSMNPPSTLVASQRYKGAHTLKYRRYSVPAYYISHTIP